MVDDNVQARPQYGFNSASIVYQAPADGGETRYMMVFQEKDAKRVEPVRSGRPYFVNWASEYRSAFAHYGGDAKTLLYLPKLETSTSTTSMPSPTAARRSTATRPARPRTTA